MTVHRHAPLDRTDGQLTSYWLPPRTRGNGLRAQRMAELIELEPDEAESLLAELTPAGIAARRARNNLLSHPAETRVWVDPLFPGVVVSCRTIGRDDAEQEIADAVHRSQS